MSFAQTAGPVLWAVRDCRFHSYPEKPSAMFNPCGKFWQATKPSGGASKIVVDQWVKACE
jgi:hypothetical protein